MYVSSTDVREIVAAIERLAVAPDDVVFIMLGEERMPDLEGLVEALRALPISFCGGIFPGLIQGSETRARGAIVQVLAALMSQKPTRSASTKKARKTWSGIRLP